MLNNNKTAAFTVLACVMIGSVSALATESAQVRVLHFPKDRSMGMLAVRDVNAYEKPYQGFEEFCEARGDVVVAVDKEVLLDLSRESTRDLSPLAKLKSDDLHSIDGWRIPIKDQDLRHLAGLTGLKRIYFHSVPISDKGLYHLKDLKSLECLVLMDTKVTDTGMSFLSGMDSLEFLNLCAVNVTDKGLEFLSGLTSLKNLNLGYCKITDAGLEHLRGLDMLESLDLYKTAVTDNGLAHLKNLRSLSDLDLDSIQVMDTGMAHISALPSLKKLKLRKARITDSGLAHLAKVRTLEELQLGSAYITDSGLKHLRRLNSLKKLDIQGQISDEGLRHLSDLTSLESLTLPRRSAITEDGLVHLAGLRRLKYFRGISGDITIRGLKVLSNMALETIHLRGEGITDETMPYIAQLKNLQELELHQCSVTNAGLSELSKLNSLKSLKLIDNPQMTGAALVHIGRLTSLEILEFTEVPQVSDKDIAHLSGLKGLTNLQLDSNQMTDAGMTHLSQLTSLESLSLENSRLTDAALSCLTNMKKLRNVHIAGNFTDEGLKHLGEFTLLKTLTLSGNDLSIEAIEELKKKLPALAYLKAEGTKPRNHSLLGQQLTEFDGISIDFKLDQVKGKMILIYFWDMKQRPSRHGMIQLSNQAEPLKEKGVEIVAIQASIVDEKRLGEWMKKNHVHFPVGMVHGDEEKVRFTWGVKSLPWLILINKQHTVTAEGFRLDELSEKITEALNAGR